MTDIKKILEDHAAWIADNAQGKRADLSEAYLSEADLRGANLSEANLSGANLSGANLSGANLGGANLSEADLCGANLSEADLCGADLSEAYLRGAYLSGANLRRANLRGADLRGAYLREADLRRANLRGADLRGAYLREADLRRANLSGADLSGAIGLPEVQKFAIDEAVFAACSAPNSLEMGSWHTCDTMHCRAGWAVVLHPQGRELEEKYGTCAAGALIYNACSGYVPDFYASNKDAMKDIVERAIK